MGATVCHPSGFGIQANGAIVASMAGQRIMLSKKGRQHRGMSHRPSLALKREHGIAQIISPTEARHRESEPSPSAIHLPFMLRGVEVVHRVGRVDARTEFHASIQLRFSSANVAFEGRTMRKVIVMDVSRSSATELRDLDYRCHFIGTDGVIEGLRLFSSPDDAAAEIEALEGLRERASSTCVELWKNDRFIARYSTAP